MAVYPPIIEWMKVFAITGSRPTLTVWYPKLFRPNPLMLSREIELDWEGFGSMPVRTTDLSP
jgi:hypothetical protein